MTMLPTFLAGANWVMHAAGWLEGGLVACYEKFIVDIELLQMMRGVHSAGDRRGLDGVRRARGGRPRRPLPGRCYTWSASAPASTARWSRRRRTTSAGCATAARTRTSAWRADLPKKLDDYEQPALDDAVRQELEEYVVRRRAELGD